MIQKLNINFRYNKFSEANFYKLNQEDKIKKLEEQKNRIYLDVGKGYRSGIIDKHYYENKLYSGEYSSTSKLVAQNPLCILSNIDYSINEVELILPAYPDIDSLVAVYLTQQLICYKKFPQYYEKLVEYTDDVILKKFEMCEGRLEELYPVVEAIMQTMNDEFSNAERESNEEYFINKILREVELIDYTMKNLEIANEIVPTDLNNRALILMTNKYTKEIEYLRGDYEKYIYDRDKKGSIEKVKLGTLDGNGSQEVSVLYMSEAPQSHFIRHWAWGEGIYLLVVPVESSIARETEETWNKSNGQYTISLKKYKFQMARNQGVWLKNIDLYLNIAEQKIANEKFDGNKKLIEEWIKQTSYSCQDEMKREWRSTGETRKYNEVYTPDFGTLLSLDDIKLAVKRHTSICISEMNLRYIYPIYFDPDNYRKIKKIIKQYQGAFQEQANIKNIDYGQFFAKLDKGRFLPYIQNFLFKENNDALSIYEINHTQRLNKESCCKTTNSADISLDNYEIQSPILYLFKYGVGFITFNINKKVKYADYQSEDLIKQNIALCDLKEEVFERFITNKIKPIKSNTNLMQRYIRKYTCKDIKLYLKTIPEEKGLIYQYIDLYTKPTSINQKQAYIYNLCNLHSTEDQIDDSAFINNILADMYQSINENIFYGLGKYGGILVTASKESDIDVTSKKKIAKYKSLFNMEDFYIFLLALQQRSSLIYYSDQLAEYADNKKARRMIRKLRKRFLSFTTKGKFNEVTNDIVESQLYLKWNTVFNIEMLNGELDNQLAGVHEYYQSKVSNILEKLSVWIAPLALFSTICDIGLFRTQDSRNNGVGLVNDHSLDNFIINSFFKTYIRK